MHISAEAIKQYGKDNVTLYKSKFNPMYYAVCKHKEPSAMKLVCVGPEERVVGVHLLGFGADEMLQGFAVAVTMGKFYLKLFIFNRKSNVRACLHEFSPNAHEGSI